MAEKMTVLVATVGQGVMRSTDGGGSWGRAGIDQGMHSDAIVRCLASDPARPEVIFAGTDKGLYRSEDAAGTWKLLETPMSGYSVWNIAIDSEKPEVIYAGTGTPTPATIFRSTDRGASWEKLPIQVADTCPNVRIPRFTGLAIDPQDHRKIWAGIEVDGVRYSVDGGESWQSINGAITNLDVHCVTVAAGPPKTVVVVVNNGIFTSTDDGATWKGSLAKEIFPLGYPRHIAPQPGSPKVLFLGLGDSTPGRTGTVLRSKDAGHTWENLSLPVEPNSAIWAIGMHAADPNIVFAGSRYGYLYRSNDGGDSWSKEWRELSEISAVTWVPA